MVFAVLAAVIGLAAAAPMPNSGYSAEAPKYEAYGAAPAAGYPAYDAAPQNSYETSSAAYYEPSSAAYHGASSAAYYEPASAAYYEPASAAYYKPSSAVSHQAPSPVYEAPAHVTSSPIHVVSTYAELATSKALDVASALPTASYGSGNSNWGGSGYDDCVQQCVASNTLAPAAYTPAAVASPTGSAHGAGATHTVIVAPAQGVLRYVPFAVNASIGDTVKFVWGANNHTVTRGSALLPCNKTQEDSLVATSFTSGLKVKDFIFEQVVNSTEPTYFFCNAPTHCQKGMFGILNPAAAFGAATSVGRAVPEMAKTDADLSAEWSYTTDQTKGNSKAANWGSNIDMSALPEWAHKLAAENVMYTRTVLAANPEVQTEDGSVDLGLSGSAPLMVPTDITLALNNAAAAPADPIAPAAPVAPTPENVDPAAGGSLATSGASSLAPSALVGALVAAFTFFAL